MPNSTVSQRKFTRRDWLIVAALTALAALLRFVRLHLPTEIVFDEVYFANFAHDYLTNTKFFDAEPPLGKFLIAGGEALFGYNSFGWRVVPALFGTAVIPLLYLLAKRLFGGRVIPTAAGLLALTDGLLLVESRTAVLDGFVVFFNLLTYTLFLLSLQATTRRRSILWIGATGVSLGLGLSLKWITLAFIAPALLILLLLTFVGWRPIRRFFKLPARTAGAALARQLGVVRRNLHHPLLYVVALGLIPAAIYLALFSLHVPFDSTSGSIWDIHRQIYNYHQNLEASHPYGSAWYTWPLLLRPVAYYFHADGGQWSGIIALGNPLIWWTGLLAMGYTAVRFWQTRSLVLLLILAGFVAHYLPWSLIPRVLFIYHYLGGLPFLMLALAYALGDLWRWRRREGAVLLGGWTVLLIAGGMLGGLLGRSLFGGADPIIAFGGGMVAVVTALTGWWLVDRPGWTTGRKQVVAFLGLVTLAFIYLLPIWIGLPLDTADYLRRMWLKSWI